MTMVIPAVRNYEVLEYLKSSESDAVFLLSCSILNLKYYVSYIKKLNKKVFLHVDLIKGLKPDKYALEYLKEDVGVEGIISTHLSILKSAKALDFYVVQRIFLVDSSAFKNGLNQAKDLKPDFIEIMPGILMEEVIKDVVREFELPIIAGGLIRTKEQVERIISAGAYAVSTSEVKLWSL